ncbi:protein of unknown function [Azospirillum lipoferum 4B]|uniref:Uncharacterized protein n=1 Tax=Azospirillum lipoferum (strain 4B) TaxID=862719 RepID=G7Z7L1_AZOL4|nr:protein of unknown function [Azospirillum lipoferum 4B]
MRPKHFCSGRHHRRGADRDRRRVASMRPKHFCSGRRRVAPAGVAQEIMASMRPKHFCSGRQPPALPSAPFRLCFNEAQAFLLGKTGALRFAKVQFETASMRPKHFCSGRPRSQSRPEEMCSMLQ